MAELDPNHHVLRHIKKSWMDGEFVDPAAFRLAKKQDGQLEDGLSVNWVEYFGKSHPRETIPLLREIFEKKGRRVGGESKFALLNVDAANAAAARYTAISIVNDEQEHDPSHALVKGYEKYNDEVAEELSKVVIDMFPAKS